MGSDTGIKSKAAALAEKRFFPLFRLQHEKEKPSKATRNINQRWSSSSDKMSSLSMRILSVNIIAIMILGAGILYLGQYTDSLIQGELDSLKTEARFISGAISEGAVRPVLQISRFTRERPSQIDVMKPNLARRMIERLGQSSSSRIRLFGVDGTLLIDTGDSGYSFDYTSQQSGQLSVEALFNQSAARFLDIIPMQTYLASYPDDIIEDVFSFPDSRDAMLGTIKATAWRDETESIVLTAAAPIRQDKQVLGVAMLVRDGHDLEKKISDIRVDVFRVFLGALGITVMLSIYLSGLISQPLKQLAIAAESVRLGKGREIDIPDMANRQDEIGELSIVLREMTKALWGRMDTIERFAADVSHEIKNPLTSLKSAVETAARIKDPDSRQKLMDIIHHDVQRLDRLISDISDASRLDAELSRDELKEVDLKALIYNLADAYKKPMDRVRDQYDENSIQITLGGDHEAYFVLGNEERLGQVFGNLISNALSFSPDDGKIVISILKQNDYLKISIMDDGPGIPDNKLHDIFERFYTERPKDEGYGNHSGLGLSISKQIIETHGGKIWAENRVDETGKTRGAVFNVELKSI